MPRTTESMLGYLLAIGKLLESCEKQLGVWHTSECPYLRLSILHSVQYALSRYFQSVLV